MGLGACRESKPAIMRVSNTMADLREALLRSEAPDSKKRQEAPCLYGLTTAECPAYMQVRCKQLG